MTSKLKSLPQTTPLLLQEVLRRLEVDLGVPLVSGALMHLACTRNGKLNKIIQYLDVSLPLIVNPSPAKLS